MLRHPLLEHRVTPADVIAGACQQSRAHVGRQGERRQLVRQYGRGDGGVLVAHPHRIERLARPHGPSDTQPRQPVCLAQASHGQHPVVEPPEGRCFLVAQPLGARVDLVGQYPRADPVGGGHHGPHLIRGHDATGRIVRIAHGDQACLGGDGGIELCQIRRPGVILAQTKRTHVEPQILRDAPDLHVVGQHDDNLLAGGQQAVYRQIIGLGGAYRDEDLLGGGPLVERGDAIAQRHRAVCLRIVELRGEQRIDALGIVIEELAQAQGMNAALGKVVVDDVFPFRHHALHEKRLEMRHVIAP